MCLNNYIGIRGCSEEEPESGLYINDVPGITTKSAANIVDSELISGTQLLENIINQSYIKVIDDIISGLGKWGYVWLPQRAIYVMNGKQTTTIFKAGKFWELDFCLCDIQRARIATLKVNAVDAGSLTINGDVYAIEAGVNELELFIDVAELELSADVDLYMYSESDTCEFACGSTVPVDMELSIFCDKCKLAEIYRDSLKQAFLLRAGIQFWQYALTTEQTSQDARHIQNIAGRMLAQLKGGVDSEGLQFEGEYKVELEAQIQAFKHIAQKYSCCFSCQGYTFSYTKL